jgi:hypothetical protein
MAKKNFTPLNLPLPDWNKRKMTSRDFEAACEHEGIAVQRFRFKSETRGYCQRQDAKPVIAIDSRLRGNERLRVEFHELGHYYLHLDNPRLPRMFDAQTHEVVGGKEMTPEQEWAECEANMVACVAIAPGFIGVVELAYLSVKAANTNWLKGSAQ